MLWNSYHLMIVGLTHALSPQLYLFLYTVHYLVQFYCDRLKDYAIVLPQVISGLHVLVSIILRP